MNTDTEQTSSTAGKTILIPAVTRARAGEYHRSLLADIIRPGRILQNALGREGAGAMTEQSFLTALINTKVPQIFAESAVAGDGSDWNQMELGILGDISMAVPVTIYDDGKHTSPTPHACPFPGTLVFTPGALLCNGRGLPPVDLAEVTTDKGSLCEDGYFQLYERRLRPVFEHVNAVAAAAGKRAFITVPGLGCGQFAGRFRGKLGEALQRALVKILQQHGSVWTNIQAVYFDPFAESRNSRELIHGITLLVRPLQHGNQDKPQLCPPQTYAESGDDFSACLFTSIVAWDHVSWPGNDFFAGSRCTDDGVKAAATNSMAVITGMAGRYDTAHAAYLPPAPFHTWEAVVRHHKLRLA